MPKGNNSNTTDKLVIDIKVNVKKSATTQINNLVKSMTELNKVVAKVGNLERYARALRQIGGKATNVTANKGISKARTGDKNLLETQDVKTNSAVTKQLKEQEKAISNQEKKIQKLSSVKDKQRKKDKKQNKEDKKNATFLGKFVKSIARIALYRAIRAGLSETVNLFKAGLDNLRASSKEINQDIKQLETSLTSLQNSVASLFVSVLPIIQPMIISVTDSIANAMNRFSESQAVLKGSSKYMKILTSDTKEWKEQVEKATGSLLDFDKFLSLNDTISYTGFVEADVGMTADEADKTKQSFDGVLDTVTRVRDILVKVFEILERSWVIVEAIIKDSGDRIENVLNKTLVLVDSIASIIEGNWQEGITNFLDGLIDSIPLINQISRMCQDVQDIIESIGEISFNDAIIKLFKANARFMLDPLGTGWTGFANGGMVEKGTRFIAGEAGAEVVHTSARGTGVTNIEQFSQAMLQALATYGVARGSDVSFKGDVYIDRTKAGQLLEGSVYGEGVRVGHFRRV